MRTPAAKNLAQALELIGSTIPTTFEGTTVRTERCKGTVGLVLMASVIAGIVAETMGPNVSMTHQRCKSANTAS